MAGTGNDFIVFDNRSKIFTGRETVFFSQICRRRVSVGGDGILLVEKGKSTPVRMRYFNSDGKETAMCGNGARCAALFAREKGMVTETRFTLEAEDGMHGVEVKDREVTLEMVRPTDLQVKLGILREKEFLEGGFINTGVPHYVLFVQDVHKVDVENLGRLYRNHPVFPQGANVDFVQILEDNRIYVRTYERGVEGETLSCGTGSVASALITAERKEYKSPVTVLTRGGELTVRFDAGWKTVTLTGRVEITFEGVLP